MKKLFTVLEQIFTFCVLFLFTEGIVALVLSGGADEISIEYENTFFRIAYPLVYLLLVGLLTLRWKKVLRIVCNNWLIFAMIAFTALSFLWSDYPGLTLRRNMALVGTSFLGLYFASRYSFSEQMRLLGWVFGTVIITSLLFVFFIPQLGIATGSHAGAWRGIFAHKNGLGNAMVLSSLTFLVLAIDAQRYRWIVWSALISSVALVVLSESVGSLLSLAVPLAAFPLYRSLRWQYWLWVPCILLVILIASTVGGLLWFNFDAVMIALGKDPSMSGRTEIWTLVLDGISRQPWLGYGYKTFWQGIDGPSAFIIRAMGAGEYQAPHAHNGILQLCLDLGIFGVVLFLVGFWQCILKSLFWIRSGRGSLCYWPLLFITYMIVTNASESRILSYNSFACVLYFSMAFSLGQPMESVASSQSVEAVSTHADPQGNVQMV